MTNEDLIHHYFGAVVDECIEDVLDCFTADGQIRTCLFSHREYDFRAALRGGASDAEIVELLKAAVWRKEPGHLINSPFFKQPERGMSAIGG